MSAVGISAVDPGSRAAREAAHQYFAELAATFPEGFDPGPDDVEPFRPPGGALLLALSRDDVLGCVGVRTLQPGTAEVKRLWVREDARGSGLGRRLLQAAEESAARTGSTLLRLDTHASLAAARRHYDRSGYREVPAYNDNPYAALWFEKTIRAAEVGRPS
ncbi:hypothetical protein ASD11_00240 [Aeromicrobium sp. Root495]|uniref:GNAT family N-acetyltransferase n=1 Tax=Aeromicrobium sp. Root495 TaxID=1736550 RepID=UPI0007014063|nr:GNAT family N-acetyltransferase [Aeromicrobium sp. Root495]KQY58139.1 hypothetical protein ASD11_00240 [Aeromicrobium sp. Root495]